jgi:hypothetical protein
MKQLLRKENGEKEEGKHKYGYSEVLWDSKMKIRIKLKEYSYL